MRVIINWTLNPALRLAVFGVVATLSLGSCAVDESKTSWTFKDLLATPSASEIAAVRLGWRQRHVEPSDITSVGRHMAAMEYGEFDVNVISYRLGESIQYGAVFEPRGTGKQHLPVIIDARGVRWDYPIRNLTNGPYVSRILAERQTEFIYLSPILRGHSFRFGDVQYDATGDRRDSWDGATDDMIAFLTVALEQIPRVDPARVVNFGASRGAGVALLHAARDKRVIATVGFATPADFFSLMGRPSEDWGEALIVAYEDSDFPSNSRESQFIEWFLEDRAAFPITEIRQRIIASSPLFFTADLPPTQLHHGKHDAPVPVRNAIAIEERLAALGRKPPDYAVFIYKEFGHQLDGSGALNRARQFILQHVEE